jgi:hypothetical protein
MVLTNLVQRPWERGCVLIVVTQSVAKNNFFTSGPLNFKCPSTKERNALLFEIFLAKSFQIWKFFTDFIMSDAQTKSQHKDMNKKGEYVRPESSFRQRITADGSSGFKAEKG